MPKTCSIALWVAVSLIWLCGCHGVKPGVLTVRGGESVVYRCENGDRIVARYYTLSDGSLRFVRVVMPDGDEYTLPQAVSASGSRYTDDRALTWWIKGDSARAEMRSQNGEWATAYDNCRVVTDSEQSPE